MILTSIVKLIGALGGKEAVFGSNNADMHQTVKSKDFEKINPMRNISGDKSHGNIMKRAADSVCYYPVIASTAISNENVRIFTKHLERNIAEMIKIILSTQDVVAVGDKDAAIAAFRGSVLTGSKYRNKADADRRHDLKAAARTKYGPGIVKENAQLILTMMEESSGYMQEMTIPLFDGLNENLLSDYMSDGINSLLEASKQKGGASEEQKAAEQRGFDKANAKIKELDLHAAKTSERGEKFQYKANEMAPTVVEAEIYYQTDSGDLKSTKIVFAVKSVLHPMTSGDMVKEIGQIISTNRAGFDAIKLFTGEISFWRDFVLNANEYKRQLSNKASPATSMFSALQKHARDNDMAQILDGKKTVPTTTLVLTTDEVEAIRDEFAEDLNSPKVAKRLMEKANLMGIYIMDEAVDTMMMFNVGKGSYDKLSLPKEESKNKQDGQVFKALAAALKN